MPEQNEAKPRPKGGTRMIILAAVLVAGALAGGGAGAVFAGPLLAEMILGPADASASVAARGPAAHGAPKSDPRGGHGAGAASYLVENLVLNPAASNGTRFLMASVSVDLMEAEAEEQMRIRDAEVRDALLTVLGHKTVEQLTDISTRDSLKSEMKSAVSALFPEGTVRGIYLPQFVIQ